MMNTLFNPIYPNEEERIYNAQKKEYITASKCIALGGLWTELLHPAF